MKSRCFPECVRSVAKIVVAVGMCAGFAPTGLMAEGSAPVSQQASIKSVRVANSLLQDIARVGDRLVVVGERGHIAYSDNNGSTWVQAEVPTRQMLNAVYFATPEKGWAVGYDGLVLNTVDGGKTWAIQLDGLKFTRQRMANQIPVLETEKKRLERLIRDIEATVDDGVAQDDEDDADEGDVASAADNRLEEAQEKLDQVESDLEDARSALEHTVANPLMDVWFANENVGYVVGAFGEFLKTADGGQTWESVAEKLNNTDRNHLNAINGADGVIMIAGEAGLIMRSDDGGDDWVRLESPDAENGSFFAVQLMGKSQVMLAGLRGSIYRSADLGNTWKQVPEELHKNMNAIAKLDADTLLIVGNDGALLRSRDGGRTVESHLQNNRLTVASVAQAADGAYVLVGAGGVQLIQPGSL